MIPASILLGIHLVVLVFVLAICLYVYYYFFVYLINKKNLQKNLKADTTIISKVDVLVPTYNEGEALVDTVRSLVAQDYLGTIKIHILAGDKNDSSLSSFDEQFTKIKESSDEIYYDFKTLDREVIYHFLKVNSKRDKVNKIINSLDSDYVAILDADHRADKNWISESIKYFTSNEVVAVQSRRKPLALQTFFQLWDSIQNHLGNEVFNLFLFLKKKNSYFTGTTRLFRTKILKEHNLPDCITEDTYWSYNQIKIGNKILFNPSSGSYEEVAPDMFSYMARRRRWSAGHHKSFTHHLSIIKSTSQLFHSLFFSLPILVLIMVYTLAIFDLYLLSFDMKLISYFLSTMGATYFGVYFYRNIKNYFLDVVVGSIVIFPFIVINTKFLHKFFLPDKYYFFINFPFLTKIEYVHVFLILSPLVLLLLFYKFFFKLNLSQIIVLILSYPIVLFLDIYSIILGFSDFIFKQDSWYKIKRFNFFDSSIIPEDLKKVVGKHGLNSKKYTWPLAGLILLILFVLINDLFPFHNCGMPKYILEESIFLEPPKNVFWDVEYKKEVKEGLLNLKFQHHVKGVDEYELEVKTDNKNYAYKISSSPFEFNHLEKLGFEEKNIQFYLKYNQNVCVRNINYSTSVKEIRNKKLYLNGEPFLIKGVVPSYSSPTVDIDHKTGLDQIKSLGANAIRIYHEIYDQLKNKIYDNHFMVIDQTRNSTWENIKLKKEGHRKKLLKDYNNLVKSNKGFPFILTHNLGNELELSEDLNNHINLIKEVSAQAKMSTKNELMSYSTYLSFVPYPTDILGINMLDSGDVYWDRAFKLIEQYPVPVYASELGGFVAHFELPDDFYRTYRLVQQWKKIVSSPLQGAVIFQSHDNWAQPVNIGFNDPTKSEMYDDLRGLWDHENKAKEIIHFIKMIFSDLEISDVTIGEKKISFSLKNIRPYVLKNIYFNRSLLKIILAPSEKVILEINKTTDVFKKYWDFNYQTHSGLKSVSSVYVNLDENDLIKIHNKDFYQHSNGANFKTGYLLENQVLNFSIPNDWKYFYLNNQKILNDKPNYLMTLNSHFKEIEEVWIKNNNSWILWNESVIDNRGELVLKINIQKYLKDSKLFLQGVANNSLQLSTQESFNNAIEVECHSYRECFISLENFNSNYVYLKVDRQFNVYVTASDSVDGIDQEILFSRPKVFKKELFSISQDKLSL